MIINAQISLNRPLKPVPGLELSKCAILLDADRNGKNIAGYGGAIGIPEKLPSHATLYPRASDGLYEFYFHMNGVKRQAAVTLYKTQKAALLYRDLPEPFHTCLIVKEETRNLCWQSIIFDSSTSGDKSCSGSYRVTFKQNGQVPTSTP